MTSYTVSQIAETIGGRSEGELDLVLCGLSEPGSARHDQLAVAMDPKYVPDLALGKARAAILAEGQNWQALGLSAAIFVSRPRLAMARLTAAFSAHGSERATGIHPTAIIAADAKIGAGCRIGPHVVIESNAIIQDGVVIGPNSWVGPGTHIGARSQIGANASICSYVRMGQDVICHPGVAIGSDGFSFVTEEKSAVETVRETMGDAHASEAQDWLKIHSLGGVVIGDRVEIGANSSVDAGTVRPTRIGDGTKIDALVQVGHNADVGRNCLLCAHVAVGGSAVIGDHSVLGGQVGVADNITLGNGVIAGGATKILSNVPAGRALLGYPAMKLDNHVETYKALRRLPKLFARVAGLEKVVKGPNDADDA